MIIYHALLVYNDTDTCCFQPFAYDLLGTARSLNFKELAVFLLHSRFTEKGCARLCRRLNKNKSK